VGGSTRLFVYDEDGRLLGEYDAAGNLIQETVWLEDTPVALIQPKAGGGIDIRHVWADHLDTPRAITTNDAAATTLWTWDSDPFGTTAATGSIEYNLRFPGQYFDAETGTHYNYFLDYNPQTGRYVQSDPIGQLAGANTYLYAMGSPLGYLDSSGLILPKPPRGAGAVPPGQRDPQRFFTDQQIQYKLMCQGGQCAHCQSPINSGIGHHKKRHADGGRTLLRNLAVVCYVCHKWLHSK
jgi:RHS repeat-associated protein